MPPGNPSAPRPLRSGRAATPRRRTGALVVAGLFATALAGAGCKMSPAMTARTRSDRGAPLDGPEPRGAPTPPPTAAIPSALATPAVVGAADPLGIPPPPTGSQTSDRGDRLARPSPVGQLAPEDAPPAPTGR